MRTYRAAGQPKTKKIMILRGMIFQTYFDKIFLAALQPYKSSCPPLKKWSQNFKSILSLVIKTKLVQNVNRMSERQNDMPKPKDRLTDRQTDRRTERQKDR